MADRQNRRPQHRRTADRRPVEPRADELAGGKFFWGDGDLELVKSGGPEEPIEPRRAGRPRLS